MENRNEVKGKKPGWYYAASDVGGAISWGQLGTLAGPLGTAVGIVIGGVGTSAWNWYWDQPSSQVKSSEEPFTRKFDDIYEQAGYLHNELIVEFTTENPRPFENPEELVDALYEPVSMRLAESYGLPIDEVYSIFSREQLVEDLNRFSKTFDELNKDVVIENISSIIAEKYENSRISEFIREILTETADVGEDFPIEEFINKKIEVVRTDESFKETEKEILFSSLNVFKYSFALWRANT